MPCICGGFLFVFGLPEQSSIDSKTQHARADPIPTMHSQIGGYDPEEPDLVDPELSPEPEGSLALEPPPKESAFQDLNESPLEEVSASELEEEESQGVVDVGATCLGNMVAGNTALCGGRAIVTVGAGEVAPGGGGEVVANHTCDETSSLGQWSVTGGCTKTLVLVCFEVYCCPFIRTGICSVVKPVFEFT